MLAMATNFIQQRVSNAELPQLLNPHFCIDVPATHLVLHLEAGDQVVALLV